MSFVLSVDLGEGQRLIDTVNASEYSTKLTLSDFLALEVRFWLAAHATVLLLDGLEI